MKLIQLAVFVGLVAFAAASRHQITSPPTTDWGAWGIMERCQGSSVVHGFQLKVEGWQGSGAYGTADDTALNAIRLFCGDPFAADTQVITSSEGHWGNWGAIYSCYPGVFTGFQLSVHPYQGYGDDTATNNVRFFCNRDNWNPHAFLEGDGMLWGQWTDSKHCHSYQGICGIQTQVQSYQGNDIENGDDTSLNRLRVECCDYQTTNQQIRCAMQGCCC